MKSIWEFLDNNFKGRFSFQDLSGENCAQFVYRIDG